MIEGIDITRTQRKKENGIAFLMTYQCKSDEDILKLQLRLSKEKLKER